MAAHCAVVPRHVPGPGASQRDAGEKMRRRIAVKLADGGIQLRHRHRLRLAVPLVRGIALREDDDRFVPLAETFQRRGQALR